MDDSKWVDQAREEAVSEIPEIQKPLKVPNIHEVIFYGAAIGESATKIAEDLGYSPATICNIINKEESKVKIKELRWRIFGEDAKKRFNNLVPKAMDVVEEILNDEKLKAETKLSAAREVFDRSLGKSVQHLDVGGNMVADLIKRLDERSRAPISIDSTVENIPDADVVVPSQIENIPIRKEETTRKSEDTKKEEKTEQEIDAWLAENI